MDSNGSIVFFRGREVWLLPQDLRQILDRGGFTATPVPTLDPVQRARACAADFRTGRSTGHPVRVEVLASDSDYIELGILFRSEVVPGRGGEIAWVQRDRVLYATGTGWSRPSTREGELFVAAAERWQTHVDYRWLRDRFVLPGLNALGAFLVSPSGGLYFVGPDGQAELERYRGVVRECGSSQLHRIALGDDPDSRAAIADAAHDALSSAVAEVRTRLEAWTSRANGRPASVSAMVADLAEIRARAQSLGVLLQFGMEAIEETIAEASAELEAALLGCPGPTPAPARVASTDRTRKAGSMVTMAVEVLRLNGPMHYRPLTEAVLAAGFTTQGLTPWETLNAQLCVWAREPGCPVIRVAPGTWALKPEAAPEPSEAAPEPELVVVEPTAEAFEAAETELDGPSIPTPEEVEQADGRLLATWCRELGVRGYVRMTAAERRAAISARRGEAAEA